MSNEEEKNLSIENRRSNIIGSGSFGVVRKATIQGHDCAVKKFNVSNTSSTVWSNIPLREVSSLVSIPPHPNIIPLSAIFIDERKKVNLIFPRRNCTLYDYMKYTLSRSVSDEKILKWTRQLVSALAHIHEHNFVHRDIKLENILIDQDENVEIADFGQAKFIPFKSFPVHLTATVCSPCTRAPELIDNPLLYKTKYYDEKIDSWSLGIVLLTLVAGKYVIQTKDIDVLKRSLQKYSSVELINLNTHRNINPLISETIVQLLEVDPKNRVRVLDLREKFDIKPVFRDTVLFSKFNGSIIPETVKFVFTKERKVIGTFISECVRTLKCNMQTFVQSLLLWSKFVPIYTLSHEKAFSVVDQFHSASACVSLISKIQEYNYFPMSLFARLASTKQKVIAEWEQKIMETTKGQIIENISFEKEENAILFCCFFINTDLEIKDFDATKNEHFKETKIYKDHKK